ncbi:hypothetical protein F5Y15DRAFT_363799 [Xylariaceae sp. FL0016]|nr:hypothetical protein F5Y15DRAFT_363799 [Xylariaceae sp. FL0016]
MRPRLWRILPSPLLSRACESFTYRRHQWSIRLTARDATPSHTGSHWCQSLHGKGHELILSQLLAHSTRSS